MEKAALHGVGIYGARLWWGSRYAIASYKRRSVVEAGKQLYPHLLRRNKNWRRFGPHNEAKEFMQAFKAATQLQA